MKALAIHLIVGTQNQRLFFACCLCILFSTVVFSQQTIESNPAGGQWNLTTTWVGETVPTSTDDVIINGTVLVPIGSSCNNIVINGTLKNAAGSCSSGNHLTVFGSIENNGEISNIPETWCSGIRLVLHGNIINNGLWEPYVMILSGDQDQYISTAENKWLSPTHLSTPIEVNKTAGKILASSDIYLQKELDLKNTIELDMQENALYIDSERGKVVKGNIINASRINFTNSARLGGWNNNGIIIYGQEIEFSGEPIISPGNLPVIVNGNLTINGPMTNIAGSCGSRHLRVLGNFTNNATIYNTPDYYCGGFRLELAGDVTNKNTWTPQHTFFIGDKIQNIASLPEVYFSNTGSFSNEKTGGDIIAVTPFYLACDFDLNRKEFNINKKDLHLKGNGTLRKGNLINAENLYFTENAKMGRASQDTIRIKGDTILLHDIAAFTPGVEFYGPVTVVGTFRNDAAGALNTLFKENVYNYGVIQNITGAYQANNMYIEKGIFNYGTFDLQNLYMIGNSPRTVSLGNATVVSRIAYRDTLILVGKNSFSTLAPEPGYADAYAYIMPDAEVETIGGDLLSSFLRLTNRGKVFWWRDINPATSADYKYFQSEVRTIIGSGMNRLKIETFGESQAPGTKNGINRYWRLTNQPVNFEEKLNRLILRYDENSLLDNIESELKVFYSNDGGFNWEQITTGVTVSTTAKTVTITNAPAVGTYTLASNALGISEMLPTLKSIEGSRGGKGSMSVSIYGSGFADDSEISLVNKALGVSISPESISISSLREHIIAQFELKEHPAAIYDVVVALPNGTEMVLEQAFTIEEAEKAAPFVHLSGREQIMLGRWQTYTITYGNTSNIDARAVPIYIAVSNVEGLDVEFRDFEVTYSDYAIAQGHDEFLKDMPLYFETDTAFSDVNGVRVYALYIPRIAANSVNSVRIRVKSNQPIKLQVALQDPLFINPFDAECVFGVLGEGIIDIAASAIPGVGCALAVGKNAFKTTDSYLDTGTQDWGSWLYDWTVTAVDCGINLSGAGAFAKGMGIFFTNMYGYKSSFDDCRPNPVRDRDIDQVASADPNDKIGPAGYTDQNYIAYPEDMPYIINFENISTATAPAQTVSITDMLDLSVYEIESFRFGNIQFDSTMVQINVGTETSFKRVLDMRPERDYVLVIEGALNTETGKLTWEFTTIDPLTGELTEDPLGGFLIPNNNSPEGEGSVSFFIKPKQGLAHNTAIANQASIVFDVNAPIVTDVWSNRLDLKAPVSSIIGHNLVSDNTVEVLWQGTDEESGIREYTLHVKEDNELAYSVSFSGDKTSTTFIGEIGKTYEFSISATDSVGNSEIAKASAELTLTMKESSLPTIKKENTIRVYPIPANSSTIYVESSFVEPVTVIISTVTGSEVIKRKVDNGIYFPVNISSLKPGTYILRIEACNEVIATKIVVL